LRSQARKVSDMGEEKNSGNAKKRPSTAGSTFFSQLGLGLSPDMLRVFIVSAVLLLLYRFHCTGRFYTKVIGPTFNIPSSILFGFPKQAWESLSTFFLLFIVPIVIARFIDKNGLSEIGLAIGDWRKGLRWTAILFACMLPAVIAASFLPAFKKMYPSADEAANSLLAFVAFEAFMLLYFIAWEFFFRGYMLFTLEKMMGRVAILVQMVPFALLHNLKPEPEALGAIVAGIVLGYFALATRSFLYCALLHFLVALSMDIAALVQKGVL